jgi:vitamin B12 transporter
VRFGALIAWIGAAAFAASSGWAESASLEREDGDGDVEAYVDVEELIVYGFRPGKLPDVPGPATHTLYVDDFVGENKSLADLLSETEGVSVRRFGGVGDRSELTIRGSTPSQVVVTLDGVRANSSLTGGLNLSRICLPLVEQVEVTAGAGTLEVGGGAIGGVVNIMTRDAASPGTHASFTAGAFETFEGSLLHSGATENFDYTAGYCGFSTQGDFEFARPIIVIDGVASSFEPDHATRVNNDREQHAGTLVLGTELLGGRLRFSNYGAYSSGGEPGVDSSNGVTAGQSTAARSRDLSNLAQLRWERTGDDAFFEDVHLMLYHRYETSNFRDPLKSTPGPEQIDTELSTPGLQFAVSHSGGPLGHSNRVDFRFDAAHDMLRASNQSGRDRPRVGAALRDTLKLFSDRLQISAGVRLDWTEDFDPEWLPSVGLIVQPWPWIRARAQFGRAYRAPNFDELYHPDEGFIRGNPDLDPEDAWNFDVGLDLAFEKAGPFSNLTLRAAWFHRDIDESIVFLRINAETIQPRNTGEATSEGYEISASLDLTRYAHLVFNYTDTDSRRDRTGSRLPGQASREAFSKLRLGPADFWKVIGEFQYVGDILASEANGLRLPSRSVWNGSVALNLVQISAFGLDRWLDELWVFARGDNLTDEATRDVLTFPQPGRRFSSGFEVAW